MKYLVLGFIKWLLVVTTTLTIISLSLVYARGQNRIVAPPYYSHPDHENLEDMESDIRLKSIFVISTEPNMVYWKKETKMKVDVGSFSYDSRSRVNRESIQKGCYIALYCVTHDYLYALYPCKE